MGGKRERKRERWGGGGGREKEGEGVPPLHSVIRNGMKEYQQIVLPKSFCFHHKSQY